jgi:hypothetical protein
VVATLRRPIGYRVDPSSMRAPALAIVIVLATSGIAHAACPAMAGADAALAVHDDEARIAWIQGRLARTSHRATIWLRGWEIGIVGATAIDLALIPILGDNRSNRIDFGLGAATTIIGVVPLLFWQPRVLADHRALDALAANKDRDRCMVLADAERRLIADAAAQRKQRAWYMHVGNVVLNAGVTLLFGAFDHWTSGVLNGIGGALVGELIIYSEPVDQIGDLAHYRRGELASPTRHAWQLFPTTAPHGAGLVVAISFR